MNPVVVETRATRPYPERRARKGSVLYNLITTTDPKTLGIMYIVTAFVFFLVGG